MPSQLRLLLRTPFSRSTPKSTESECFVASGNNRQRHHCQCLARLQHNRISPCNRSRSHHHVLKWKDPSSGAQLDTSEPLRVDSTISGDTQPRNLFAESVKLQLHGMPSLTDYCSCGTGSLHTGKDQHH